MKLALTEAAKADIRAILRRTREQFGPLQVPKYRALLTDARKRIREQPTLGHAREGLPSDWRLFHISQPGRAARHFLLYVVREAEGVVIVLRVLHDAMNIPRRWQG